MTTTSIDRPAGLWRDEQHRYYYGPEGPFPGVTNVIKILDRSGPLVGWAKRETAACAVRNLDLLNKMVTEGDREGAIKWLSGIPDFQRDEAAHLGSRIHEMADKLARHEDVDPTSVEVPYLRAYRDFLQTVRPRIAYSETLVLNRTDGYGGTLDLGVELDGAWTLLDIKTGRDVYDEVALQLAGYALGELTAAPDDPTPMPLPQWERFGVVHLKPDDWSLVPIRVDDDTKQAFRDCLTLSRWNDANRRFIKGAPIKRGDG